MVSTLLTRLQTVGLLTLFFLTAFSMFSQNIETFTHIPTDSPGNYSARTWNGDNNETWSATDARTDQTINGKAIIVRNGILTTTIPGGIGDLMLTTQRKFSGGNGDLTVSVNGNVVGTIPYDDTVQTNSITGINVSGSAQLVITTPGNGDRVAMDDLTWTSYVGGGNAAPLINNITQVPGSNNVTSSDAVSVSADLIDSDGIGSAELRWGTVSGSLTNTIGMSFDAGNTYVTNSSIPAQADGTIVYYEIEATDSNATPLTSTSAEQSYTVTSGTVVGNIEDFTNSNVGASYSTDSFIGNNGIEWSYVASRDGNNDANSSGINLPALMLRRTSDDSKVYSSAIPNGIGDFSVKLYKGFTGGGDREVELFVNGVSQGTSTPFNDFGEHIFQVNGIDIPGNVVIEIRNITSNQIIVDDITWTDFGGSSPILSATTTSISGLDYIENSGPSAPQTFDISGLNLDPASGNITVTAPTNFEVSTDDIVYSGVTSLAYTQGELTTSTVYVRLQSGLANNTYTDSITISGGNATDVTIAVSGEVSSIPSPTLTALPTSITGLNYMVGNGPSSAQTFEISGDLLNGSDVNITVPAQFEISTDDITYSSSLVLTAYDGSNTTLYVRLVSGLVENTYSGDANISGGGATAITVSLEGNVTPFVNIYNGTGVFELITSISDLTDGYYVIAEASDSYAMNNNHTSNYLDREAITVVNSNTVVNPGTDIAWYIETNGAGHTIYNDIIEKYVSYTGSSNQIQIVDNVATDNQRWSISYANDEFVFTNLAISTRMLQYNASSPRFAAYTSNLVKLHLYKLTAATNPVLVASPDDIIGLDYVDGQGPSVAQSFELSGLNLPANDDVIITLSDGLTSDFEISLDENTGYSQQITLTNYDGSSTIVYVRLKSGLITGPYNDLVEISGYSADLVEVTVSGNVVDIFDIPYSNSLRNQQDWDDAITDGFNFDGTSFQTSGNGYVRLETVGGSITSPEVDFSNYDMIVLKFSLATFGTINNPLLSVQLSDDGGLSYSTLETFSPLSSTYTSEVLYVDVSAINSAQGRIRFEYTSGSNIRFRDLAMEEFQGFFYSNGMWKPADPNGTSTPADDIYVVDGTTTFTSNTTARNIIVNTGATLNIESILTIAGDITNNGDLVFISNATANGELAEVPSGSNINGTVTVQNYMSLNRAYRMVSSPVTTPNSIHDNWQEGAISAADNPASGFGTHITGTLIDQQNGFDATATGNPSMFTVDVANQVFEPIDNTDINTLTAGDPFLLFVRGDRSIDLTDDTAKNETVLRATGTMLTGSNTQTYTGANGAGDFVMFGNPYQSAVDITTVFANSTNINSGYYYVYDPTLGDHGAYITIDLSDTTANKYLQPGQAAQVATSASGSASIVFGESDKAPGNFVASSINGQNADNALTVQLYTEDHFDNGGPLHDNFRIIFEQGNDNGLTPEDAVKPLNFYENLGIDLAGTLLSIENRDMPQPGEIFNLFANGYESTDYVLKMTVDGLDNVDLFLDDDFTGSSTKLEAGDNAYAFSVDSTNVLSVAVDRFSIRTEKRLGVGNNELLAGIQVYPNPMTGNTFYINAPAFDGEQLEVRIIELTGRNILEKTLDCEASTVTVELESELATGIYLVTITHNDEGKTFRLIKE